MKFDPYAHLLRVFTSRRPLTHYELLRLDNFETDADAISHAVQYQTGELKQHRDGPHAAIVSRLQGEINQAAICLANPERKKSYDADLLKIPLYAALHKQRGAAGKPQLKAPVASDPEAARLERLNSLIEESPSPAHAATGFVAANPQFAGSIPAQASSTDRLLKGLIVVGGLGSVVLAVSAVALLYKFSGKNDPTVAVAPKNNKPIAPAHPTETAEKNGSSNKNDSVTTPVPASSSKPSERPAANKPIAPPAPTPADAFDALPDAWITPSLSDISKRDLPVSIGVVNLPAERHKEMQIELRDAQDEKMPHPALAIRSKPNLGMWQLMIPDPAAPKNPGPGQPPDRGVILGDFTMRGQALSFYWGGRAPLELPPESRQWSLRIAAGDREKIVVMGLPGFAAPVAANPAAAVPAVASSPQAGGVAPAPPLAPKAETLALGLAKHVDLPDQNSEEHRADEISLGKLAVEADDQLAAALLEPTLPRKASGKFRLQPEDGAEPPAWHVFYDRLSADSQRNDKSQREGQPAKNCGEEQPAPQATVAQSLEFARLWCRENGEVALAWLPAAYSLSEADRFRNCAIEFKRGELQQYVRLRQPAGGPPYVLDLQEDHILLPIAGAGLPDSEIMFVEVLSHSGFPAPSQVVPLGSKKKSDPLRIVVRPEVPTVELHLRPFDNSKGHSLRITPLLCDGDSDDTLPFTAPRMGSLTTGIAKELNKNAVLLQNELAVNAQLSRQMAAARAIGEDAKRNAAMSTVSAGLRNSNTAIQRLRRRAVTLEAQAKAAPSLIAVGEQIHKHASLKLRVYFLAGSCQVDVLRLE